MDPEILEQLSIIDSQMREIEAGMTERLAIMKDTNSILHEILNEGGGDILDLVPKTEDDSE